MKTQVLVVILCAMGAAANFHNFISIMNENFNDNIFSAWDYIKNAIKRPVRTHKIRHETVPTTTPALPLDYEYTVSARTTPEITSKQQNTVQPDMMYYFQRPKHKQVILPVLTGPKWRSRNDWLTLQQPNFASFFRNGMQARVGDKLQGINTVIPDGELNSVEDSDEDSDEECDEDIGVMMFI